MNQDTEFSIRTDFHPGDIGYITYLHGVLYSTERGWDSTFEAYVADPLAHLALNPNPRSRIWIVEHGSMVAGSIAVVEASEKQAQLRWFLVHPVLRGRGVGKHLIESAVSFCREQGYSSVFLWTVAGLDSARKLYEAAGFSLTEEKSHELWGAFVTEQRFELSIHDGT